MALPAIPALNPLILNGVVREFQTPQQKVLLSRIPRRQVDTTSVQWDIVRGSRSVARLNTPNSEAHIIDRLGRSSASASFAYAREKKIFVPTSVMWARQPGDLAAIRRMEDAILLDVRDLNERLDNLAEILCWQALTGGINYTKDNADLGGGQVSLNVDYQFSASHKITSPTVSWLTATPDVIVQDISSWQRLIFDDTGGVVANEVWTSRGVMDKIINSFLKAGVSGTFLGGTLMSDRMKDEYFSTGTLNGFMGLNWNVNTSVYDPTDSGYTSAPTKPNQDTKFLADGRFVLGNLTDGRPMELVEGPEADFTAGQGYIGKFAKTFSQEDPSGYTILLSWHFLPVVTRPDQIVTVTNVLA